MKLASKWIVVPYREFNLKAENTLNSKEKIERLINNKTILDTDKLNLLNQLITKNNINNETSIEIQPNIKESPENFQFENENCSIDKNLEEITVKKPKTKKKRTIESVDDLVDQTFENTQHYLPPTAATRKQTKKFLVPVEHLSIEKEKKKKAKKTKITESQQEKEDPFEDAYSEITLGNGLQWESYYKPKYYK